MSGLVDRIRGYFKDLRQVATKDRVIIAAWTMLGCFVANCLVKTVTKKIRVSRKAREAEEIRRIRDEKVEKFLKEHQNRVSKERIHEIISLDASNLLKKIREKEVSVVEALLAYAIRAGTVGRDYGWITDVDFEKALKQAEEYQKLIDEDNESEIKKYPLFGLPVSVKDQMSMVGITNTAGYTMLGKAVSDFDSMIVQVMRRKGAIPFVHTNVPQGYLAMDSCNHLWGMCNNPWNPKKIAGGSSGGEGGLVGARCSVVGLGSDIGGSIRIPSVLCGCYGFKPTSNRISKHGGVGLDGKPYNGFQGFVSSWGPICRSADDVILMARNLFGEFSEDPYINNKPFDENLFNSGVENRNVKIGYYFETRLNEATPSIAKAVGEVADNLQKQGYEVVKFQFEQFEEFISVGLELIFNCGARDLIIETLDGEPLYYYYDNLNFLWTKPRWFILLLSKVCSVLGEKRASYFLSTLRKFSKTEFLEKTRRFLQLRSEFISFMRKENIQALISPVLPVPCVSHGTANEYPFFNEFNFLPNMADLPACTIPLYLNNDTNFSSKFNDRAARLFEREAKESLNVPIGIQVAALPMHDELALRLMKNIASMYEFEKKDGPKVVEILDKRGKSTN